MKKSRKQKKLKTSKLINVPAVNTASLQPLISIEQSSPDAIVVITNFEKGNAKKKQKKRASKKTNEKFLEHWLKQKLRRISYQYPARKEVQKKARISRGKYRCASCLGENFGPRDIQMDHIVPVIDPHTGFTTWQDYIERLFVDESGWSVLCRPCHESKTIRENLIRKEVKREKNEEDDI